MVHDVLTWQATALIADDEPVLRFHLQKLLAELAPRLDVIATAANGDEALALVRETRPDVVFLDIKMPGKTGLEVALAMQQEGLTEDVAIVFLTAYDQYAVTAFEREAVDYLLKPVEASRLTNTLVRLSKRAAAEQDEGFNLQALKTLLNDDAAASRLRWINAQRGEDIHVLAVDDVLMFRAEDKYTTVFTPQGEFLIRRSLKQLEDELDQEQFWRIHRSTLVQVSAIEKVHRSITGQYRLHVKGVQAPVAISRRFAERFKQM